jgi:hypothetical protein
MMQQPSFYQRFGQVLSDLMVHFAGTSQGGWMRARNLVAAEPLERRRLLGADLEVGVSPVYLPNVVLPEQSFPIPMNIYNRGSLDISQAFVVGARLVPVALGNWRSLEFNSLAFINGGGVDIGSTTHVGLEASGLPVPLTIEATIPTDIASGLYRLVVMIDANYSIIEDGELDNQKISLPVAVLSAAGVMKIPGSAESESVRMVPTKLDNKPAVKFITGPGGLYHELNFRIGAVTGFYIPLGGGDDTFVVEGAFNGVTIDGSGGNDRIVGGAAAETLIGGAGKDVLDGGPGNDRLNGSGGNDKLLGNGGADRLYGYAGNDYLDGGSSGDRFDGGYGLDTMFGQSGDDRFFADDGEVDQLFGGSGKDSAMADGRGIAGNVIDTLTSVESATLIDDVP